MLYTFVIHSKDRVYGNTSDFQVRMPFTGELAEAHYWKIKVARCVFPRSNFYSRWYSTDGTGVHEPEADALIITSDFLEVRLDFGTPCHVHDTRVGGMRSAVHIVTCQDNLNKTTAHPAYTSDVGQAIEYEIARPQLAELRVSVQDKFGRRARAMKRASFPAYVPQSTTSLINDETDLPEWFFVLYVEGVEKK